MSERDDSHDLVALRRRLEAARVRLSRLPVARERNVGPADPTTGEAWHRGNVLGHLNEMLPFWTEQIRRATHGSGEIGRDESGALHRREGIDQGNAAAEAQLRRDVDKGIGGVLTLMDEMSPADLAQTVVFQTREGRRDARLGELMQILIVGHLEDHLEQLDALG